MRDQIRKLRIAAGLTQEQFAKALGYLGKQTVSGWETGRSSPPSDKLQEIASVLGVSVNDLFPKQETQEPGEVA